MTDQMNLLDWQPPAARHSDPETSQMAADRAALGASYGRLQVLGHLLCGPLTDFELAEKTGRQQTSCGKRRGECVDHGLVAPVFDAQGAAVKRPAPSGSLARVWAITDEGREFYRLNGAHQ